MYFLNIFGNGLYFYIENQITSNILIESYFLKVMQDISIIGALGCALIIPFWTNSIYSLLSLILVFLLSVIYLSFLKIKFLSLVYILVYIGAIVILFLFLIILLSLEIPFYKSSFGKTCQLHLLFSLKGAFFSAFIVDSGFNRFDTFFYNQYSSNYIANNLFLEFSCFVNDSLIFNNLLYTQFFFQFLLLSFILLVGMLGSIALTMVVK